MSGMLRLGGTLKTIVQAYKGLGVCNSFTRARMNGKKISKGKSCPSAILNVVLETEQQLLNTHKEFTPINLSKENKDEYSVEDVIDSIKNMENDYRDDIHKQELLDKGICPECKEPLSASGGCYQCPNCGYSKCD